jgi:hypothetical protein
MGFYQPLARDTEPGPDASAFGGCTVKDPGHPATLTWARKLLAGKNIEKKHLKKKTMFNECVSSLPTRLIMSDVEMSDLSEVKVFQKR